MNYGWKLLVTYVGNNEFAVFPPLDMASKEACRNAMESHRAAKRNGWVIAINTQTGEFLF